MKKIIAMRKMYAVLAAANARLPLNDSSRIIDAFSTVKREDFIGVGPWDIFTPMGYITTPSEHPVCLYQDILVALDREKMINNGQPSLHAASLSALKVQADDKVVHVGAGTGYYTAILSVLVGARGSVNAYEIEDSLVTRATVNLVKCENVFVHAECGVDAKLPLSNAIYVSAGATHPVATWLDALMPEGRLVFPLTTSHGSGRMILIEKKNDTVFSIDFICGAMFIPCTGAIDSDIAVRLEIALNDGTLGQVQSLRRFTNPDSSCLFAGHEWWLSSDSAT